MLLTKSRNDIRLISNRSRPRCFSARSVPRTPAGRCRSEQGRLPHRHLRRQGRPAEVVARLEQVAAVLLNVPIEKLIVNLLHHGVDPQGSPLNVTSAKGRGAGRLAAHVEEQLLAHAGRVLDVAEVEFLEPVVVLAGDELVEVDFEGLLVAGVHVAGIALQPNPHAAMTCVPYIRQGQMRGDVFVFVRP